MIRIKERTKARRSLLALEMRNEKRLTKTIVGTCLKDNLNECLHRYIEV